MSGIVLLLRKASEAAKDKMGAPEPSKPQPSRAPVDAELGALLLAAPLDALDAGGECVLMA